MRRSDFKPYRNRADAVKFSTDWRKEEVSGHYALSSGSVHRRSASSLPKQREWGTHELLRPKKRLLPEENEIQHARYYLQDDHTVFDRALNCGVGFELDESKQSSLSSFRTPFKKKNSESTRSALSVLNSLSDKRKMLSVSSNDAVSATLKLPNNEDKENIWDQNFSSRLPYSDSSPTSSHRSFNESCTFEEIGFLKHFSSPCEDKEFPISRKMIASPQHFTLPIGQNKREINLKINENNNNICYTNLDFSLPHSPNILSINPTITNVKIEESPYYHEPGIQIFKETQCPGLYENDVYTSDELSESPWSDSCNKSLKEHTSTLSSDDIIRNENQIQVLQPYTTDPDEELLGVAVSEQKG